MAKFDEAVAVLLLGQPFFGTLLMKMEHVCEPNLQPPTMAVSRSKLFYHPDFVESLTLDEAVFVVAHETMHQAWQHLPRLAYYLRSGVGPDGHPLDPQLYNQAMDYPINHALVVSKVGTPVATEKWPMCLDPYRFPESMTPEEVYCLLKQEQEKNGGKGNGQQAMDGHDALGDENEPDAITPADVMQAAQMHKAIRGEYPAGIERLLGQLKRPDVSPWRRLRQFITTSLPGHDATTWRKLQRRLVVRGIGYPGRVAQGAGIVGIVADTSGSIDEEVLNLFGGHMAAIIQDAMPKEVRVYWTDAKVHRVDTVKTGSELRALLSKPVPGGGGTDMPKGVRAAEADNCHAIVVLTDGFTPFTDSKKPVMWAITSHNVSSPHGTTIHI